MGYIGDGMYLDLKDDNWLASDDLVKTLNPSPASMWDNELMCQIRGGM